MPIRTNLNEAEAASFAVNHYRFPGVEIKSRLYRQYPLGKLGAHIVGYIGRINDKDIKDLEKADLEKSGVLSNYNGSDHIGKSGIAVSYTHLDVYKRQLVIHIHQIGIFRGAVPITYAVITRQIT